MFQLKLRMYPQEIFNHLKIKKFRKLRLIGHLQAAAITVRSISDLLNHYGIVYDYFVTYWWYFIRYGCSKMNIIVILQYFFLLTTLKMFSKYILLLVFYCFMKNSLISTIISKTQHVAWINLKWDPVKIVKFFHLA